MVGPPFPSGEFPKMKRNLKRKIQYATDLIQSRAQTGLTTSDKLLQGELQDLGFTDPLPKSNLRRLEEVRTESLVDAEIAQLKAKKSEAA